MKSSPPGRHLVRDQVAHMGLHRVAEAGATGIGGVGDPRVVAIAEAAKELDRLRENWRNPPDAHAALGRAVWAAYG